jgi:hypothetical protein
MNCRQSIGTFSLALQAPTTSPSRSSALQANSDMKGLLTFIETVSKTVLAEGPTQ